MRDQMINISDNRGDVRLLARVALRVIERRADEAAEHLEAEDLRSAAETMAMMTSQLITLLTPYAGTMPTFPHVILVLSNGSTIRTTDNTVGDIAGLINAGTQKIYSVNDLTDGYLHHVVVSEILDFYEATH